MKSSWELLKVRTEYYERIIKKTLELLDVDTTTLKFVQGTEFQLSEKYNLDVYILMTKVSFGEAQRAGAEVVKQSVNPLMSSLTYPLLQALDEEYLGVDIQLAVLIKDVYSHLVMTIYLKLVIKNVFIL